MRVTLWALFLLSLAWALLTHFLPLQLCPASPTAAPHFLLYEVAPSNVDTKHLQPLLPLDPMCLFLCGVCVCTGTSAGSSSLHLPSLCTHPFGVLLLYIVVIGNSPSQHLHSEMEG